MGRRPRDGGKGRKERINKEFKCFVYMELLEMKVISMYCTHALIKVKVFLTPGKELGLRIEPDRKEVHSKTKRCRWVREE